MGYYKIDDRILEVDVAMEIPTGKVKYFAEIDGKKTLLPNDEAVDKATNLLGLEVFVEQETKTAAKATKKNI